ncbi:MAG: hypothetical protein SGBAC_001910 [Bacillariaceae sp.]
MTLHDTLIDAEDDGWTAEKLQRATYKDLGSPSQVEDRFLRHLLSPCCQSAIDILLTSQSTTTRDFSLEIDAFELLLADCVLGQMLLKYPSTLLPLLENSIVRAQKVLKRQREDEQLNDDRDDDGNDSVDCPPMSVKGDQSSRVHARLVHLPPTITRNSVASMTAQDVGKIVQLSGTVVRTGAVQMYESARKYKCTGKDGCGQTFLQFADLEQRTNAMAKPDRCPLQQNGGRCKGTNLQHQKDESIHTDYQEVKIQEAASKIGIGHIPRSLMIKLQHDLVDTCQPGDEVQLVGSLLAQWQQTSHQPGVECNVGMALDAHSIRVVQENASSAWKQSCDNAAAASNQNSNASAEMVKFKKEFDAYWQHPFHEQNPISARDFICKAVCPKLYGLHIIKLGLLITLIGGVQGTEETTSQDRQQQQERATDFAQQHFLDEEGEQQQQDREDVYLNDAPRPFQMQFHESNSGSGNINYGGTNNNNNNNNQQQQQQQQQRKKRKQETAVKIRRRDMSHILIVGDPGTGKSQILRFAAALCPRSVLTTGVGTSAAGLTCAAVRDGADKEFALEAGALVLADKGICCIDEFGCIRPEDRTTIHEAMEQQTLSVAKAGIVCKLNCRATIIAVMNPKDCIYDNHASLSNNTGLGTPLLSRFDLIFKLVDTADAERDSNVTTYLLNRAIQGTELDVTNTNKDGNNNGIDETPWQMEKLRAYISIVKERFEPIICDDAAILLERHYEKVRSAQSFVIPVTVRFLESLIRLTQAHARLMYRNEATLQDAVAVLRVMECSAYAYGGFDGSVPGKDRDTGMPKFLLDDAENIMYCDPMYMDESDRQPDEDFLCFEYLILKRYDMLHHTAEERRKAAEELLYPPDDGLAGPLAGTGMEGWLGIEHPREKQVEIHHDHYGRDYVSPDKSQRTPRKRSRNH